MEPLEMHETIETLQRRVECLEAEIARLLDSRKEELEQQVLERMAAVERQVERERLKASMARRIRQSLNLEEILDATVTEVRQLLQCDRVMVYQFGPKMDGTIVAESVVPAWLPTLGIYIQDPCLQENQALQYRLGQKRAIADIYQAGFTDCHLQLLESLQIRAKLVVPILIEQHSQKVSVNQKSPPFLWGLLFANQCSGPRLWQESELELLDELGVQIAIAIQQASLFQQVQTELTKRQQAESALTESEERFRSMADSAPIFLWMMDTKGDCNFFNQTWLNFTGRTIDQEINCGWEENVHPEDFEHYVETYYSAFHEREDFQIEYRLRRADGAYRWLLDAGTPRFSPDGRFLGYIGCCIDITDRKWAEDGLYESERLYATLTEISPVGIFRTDPEGRNLYSNERSCEIAGTAPPEMLGEGWAKHLHPDDRDRVISEWYQAIREDQIFASEYRFLRPDGTVSWVFGQAVAEREEDGTLVSYIGTMTDISDRKRAETALQQFAEELENRVQERTQELANAVEMLQQEIAEREQAQKEVLVVKERLQYLLSASPTVIYSCKADGDYATTFISDNIAVLLGYQPTDFLQESSFWINGIHPEDVPRIFTEMMSNFGGGKHILEYRFLDASGSYRWLQNDLTLVRDAAGNPLEIVGSMIDITARKQGEEQIKASLKEKEVLLKEIHHRVKNNLQIISSLLKLQSKYIKDPESLALFTDSYNRIKSMALIHENLYRATDIARINAEQYVQKLVANLLNSYGFSSKQIDIKLEIDNIFLDIDTAIPCGLIINELVSNSFKYAFPNHKQGKILVSFKLGNNNTFVLRVSDSGVGLPQNFDWKQTESLGLQLVLNLTEQLGGNIDLDGSKGTDFQVHFAKNTRDQ